jgi:hypothetical protein
MVACMYLGLSRGCWRSQCYCVAQFIPTRLAQADPDLLIVAELFTASLHFINCLPSLDTFRTFANQIAL